MPFEQQPDKPGLLEEALRRVLEADTEIESFDAKEKFVDIARAELGQEPLILRGSYSYKKAELNAAYKESLCTLRNRKKIDLLEKQ